MSELKQAKIWWKEGKKVRRDYWGNKTLYGILENGHINFYDKEGIIDAQFLNNFDNLEATDWEIFEEEKKESLSDKIETDISYNYPIVRVYHEEDVKEKIQNAQKRLKEEINKNILSFEEINNKVEKIFNEEFGKKLTDNLQN